MAPKCEARMPAGALADVAYAEAEEDAGEGGLLAAFDLVEQGLCGLVADAIERGELVFALGGRGRRASG